jgi:antitoxin component HigA of HigAB toxin-antitoxin module
MESNNLRQVDLLDTFGAASVVSEVLKGKRDHQPDRSPRLFGV